MKRFEADNPRLKGLDRRTVLGAPYFRKGARPPKFEVNGRGVDIEPAHVEIILPREQDVAGNGQVDETEYQNLYLRFFRDLPEGDRLRILVELDAVPGEIAGGFNHETEGRLFRSVVRGNRFDELSDKIETALARRKQ
jgi:hypothetical protein